uniref:F-box associated domain-containing protein n=1 Tax=Tanacetum cinerariifolium TaxID=118510 RepID=A0A6L2L4W0_TANCI|nr:hypothetical protein [Tanacetum cinerariifolium]
MFGQQPLAVWPIAADYLVSNRAVGLPHWAVAQYGVIYFRAYDVVSFVDGVRFNFVISFDLKNDKFWEVSLPERLVHAPDLNVTKVNESLGLLEYYEEGGMTVCGVWSRKDGANNLFTKIYTIKVEGISFDSVLWFRNTGEVVMELQDADNYDDSSIGVYEPLSGHIYDVGINGKQEGDSMGPRVQSRSVPNGLRIRSNIGGTCPMLSLQSHLLQPCGRIASF